MGHLLLLLFLGSSPAEVAISRAQEAIKASPKTSHAHVELGRALVRRARETGDPVHLDLAERSLQRALEIEPESFDGLKVRVTVLLARHEYTKALELAKILNKRIPDDALIYGLMADAYMGLGQHGEAEKQVDWMLNFRRANVGAMIRGAQLRVVFGDPEGAIEWFTSAFRLTSATEVEERAWLLWQIARVHLAEGKVEAAEKMLGQALTLFPGYHLVTAEMAALRAKQLK